MVSESLFRVPYITKNFTGDGLAKDVSVEIRKNVIRISLKEAFHFLLGDIYLFRICFSIQLCKWYVIIA